MSSNGRTPDFDSGNGGSNPPIPTRTALDLLVELDSLCHFMSREKPGTRASKSELRRWFNNKAVLINGQLPAWDTPLDCDIIEMILFPKNDRNRCTLA